MHKEQSLGSNMKFVVDFARIDAEKVSIWNEESKEIRRALWITNYSGLTLDSGTSTFSMATHLPARD
jgi:hypothetical protein